MRNIVAAHLVAGRTVPLARVLIASIANDTDAHFHILYIGSSEKRYASFRIRALLTSALC